MKPNFNDIAKLVKQVKQQDNAAFAKLYEITYQRIYFLAYSVLKNNEDAQDAVQESYMKILANINSLQDDKCFVAWANKIVYGVCVRMAGKQQNVFLEDSPMHELRDEHEESDPINAVAKGERTQVLARLIQRLDPLLRTSLVLKYYENLKISEIATIMDCPEGTVKSRLNTAKKHLKTQIAKERAGDVLTFSIAYLPLRGALTQVAQMTSMDSLFAHSTLINALAENGWSTNIVFHPQLPSAAAADGTVVAVSSITGGLAMIAFGAAVFASPVLSKVCIVNPPEMYTNQNVVISANVSVPLNTLDEVYASYEGGRIRGTLLEDGSVIFTVSENGLYEIYAVSKTDQVASAQIEVSCIDKDGPVVSGYSNDKKQVSIVLADTLSGIDYDNIYGVDFSGERRYPVATHPDTGMVIFDLPDKNFKLYVSDLAGNVSAHRVNIVSKGKNSG